MYILIEALTSPMNLELLETSELPIRFLVWIRNLGVTRYGYATGRPMRNHHVLSVNHHVYHHWAMASNLRW
jgi:hypothetical protein